VTPAPTPPVAAELRDLLLLHLVPGLGWRRTAALLGRFGSARGILQATVTQLASVPFVGAKLAAAIDEARRGTALDDELRRLEQHGVRLLALGMPDYPELLSHLTDPPHLLYYRGALDKRDGKAVAVVGSRHCTAYGKRAAEHLAAGLVRAGYTVVSGLARGIDGVAHRAALQAGGRTVAVLAGGLSRIYPPEHAGLAKEIEAAGALISEASMDMDPLPGTFHARNRLISGLALAVVVVEANEKSGALITVRHAADQGRTVCAVPGPIDSPASAGTNYLIREGAVLVRDVEDIVEELEGIQVRPSAPKQTEPGAAAAAPVPPAPPPELDPAQRRIWEWLGTQPRHFDEMVQQLGVSVPELTTTLMLLEMKRVLRRLPGNRYERC
jgi:DNA processing protein